MNGKSRVAVRAPWELGSEFHWFGESDSGEHINSHPWSDKPNGLFGTGRGGLKAILIFGRDNRNWRRVLLPSYYCYDVIDVVRSVGLPLEFYPDGPLDEEPPQIAASEDDVVVIVNFFGLRRRADMARRRREWALIEDHTHDPWSSWAEQSTADYCFASLRKTLPVPDGAVIWSPVGMAVPAPKLGQVDHQHAVLMKLQAMLIKSRYLATGNANKPVFRRLATEGEALLSASGLAAISEISRLLIDAFPIAAWRRRRRQNFKTLREEMANVDGVNLLRPVRGDCYPFSVVIAFRTAGERESVRDDLLRNNIYPAELWSLASMRGRIACKFVELSERLLSIPCDMRFARADMKKVAQVLHGFFQDRTH